MRHRFICGMTGSGKTNLGVYFYARQRGIAIFFNTQWELAAERVTQAAGGRIVYDLQGFAQALEEKVRRICFNPSESEVAAQMQLIQIKRLLFSYGKLVQRGRNDPINWCTLFPDEVHLYSKKDRAEPEVDSVFTRGRRWGIRGVAMSQRPALVSHTILAQCDYHYIFRLKNWESPYFAKYKIKLDEYEPHLKKRFHFLLDDGTEIHKMLPVCKQ